MAEVVISIIVGVAGGVSLLVIEDFIRFGYRAFRAKREELGDE